MTANAGSIADAPLEPFARARSKASGRGEPAAPSRRADMIEAEAPGGVQ